MPKIISNTEREVVKVLIRNKQELTAYQIAKKVYKIESPLLINNKKRFIYRIMENLKKRGIVIKKNSYPSFFRLNGEMAEKRRYETILYAVRCPHCKELFWVDNVQQTKQCHCLTESNKPRRFWLSKHRFTGDKKIV